MPILSRAEMELPGETKTLLDAVRSYEPPVAPKPLSDPEDLQTLFNRGLYPGQTRPLGQRELDFENWTYRDRPPNISNLSEDVRIEDQLRNMGIKPTGDNLLDWATYKNELLKKEEDAIPPDTMTLWNRGMLPGQNIKPKWPLPEGMEFTGVRPPTENPKTAGEMFDLYKNWHGTDEASFPSLTPEQAGYTPQTHFTEGYNELLDQYLKLRGLDLNTYGAPELLYPAPPWAKHVPPKPPDVPFMASGGVVQPLPDVNLDDPYPVSLMPNFVALPTDQIGFPPEDFPYFDYTQANYAPEELDEYGNPKPDFNSADFIGSGNYYYQASPRPNVTNNYYTSGLRDEAEREREQEYRDQVARQQFGNRLAASLGSMPPASATSGKEAIAMLQQQAAIDQAQRQFDALERRNRQMQDEYEKIHRFGTPENRLFMSPVNRDYMRDFYPPPSP